VCDRQRASPVFSLGRALGDADPDVVGKWKDGEAEHDERGGRRERDPAVRERSILQPEVFAGNAKPSTQSFHHVSGQPITFANTRQFGEMIGVSPEIDDSLSASWSCFERDAALPEAVSASVGDELSQRRHLGELGAHSGREWGDSNLGNRDFHSALLDLESEAFRRQ
jgi:hypothetical protein